MSNQSDKPGVGDRSLLLYEVLEEEYLSLHGPLPIDYYEKNSTDEKRLTAICHLIHNLEDKRAAICLSGGGIRSGTFALGVLQGWPVIACWTSSTTYLPCPEAAT